MATTNDAPPPIGFIQPIPYILFSVVSAFWQEQSRKSSFTPAPVPEIVYQVEYAGQASTEPYLLDTIIGDGSRVANDTSDTTFTLGKSPFPWSLLAGFFLFLFIFSIPGILGAWSAGAFTSYEEHKKVLSADTAAPRRALLWRLISRLGSCQMNLQTLVGRYNDLDCLFSEWQEAFIDYYTRIILDERDEMLRIAEGYVSHYAALLGQYQADLQKAIDDAAHWKLSSDSARQELYEREAEYEEELKDLRDRLTIAETDFSNAEDELVATDNFIPLPPDPTLPGPSNSLALQKKRKHRAGKNRETVEKRAWKARNGFLTLPGDEDAAALAVGTTNAGEDGENTAPDAASTLDDISATDTQDVPTNGLLEASGLAKKMGARRGRRKGKGRQGGGGDVDLEPADGEKGAAEQ